MMTSASPDPTAPFQSALARPPSSVPDLLGGAVGRGELQYAYSLRLNDRHRTLPEEDDRENSLTSTISGPNSQSQVSDWRAITKDRLGVASRFAQTLLKKVPDCVDNNPVKVAFSIAKVIIEIKDVGCTSVSWATG